MGRPLYKPKTEEFMKKIVSLLLLFCAVIHFSSCSTPSQEADYEVRSRTISTTHLDPVSIISTYKDTNDDAIENYVDICKQTLEYYHKLFNIYFEYSGVNNICTINKNAGNSPVKVDEELIKFLKYCKELYTITKGKTNIMLGSVLTIWHGTREKANDNFGFLNESDLPTNEELAEASKHISIDLLVINESDSTAYISDPRASIDVGAVAKGYVVDKLYEVLKSRGADSVALNIGGNVRTIGLKPDGTKWVSGITNPNKLSEESLYCKIRIGDTSIVTSGDYERYFIAGDKEYHHIIDPETLQPAKYFSSVSIITKNSALADALSTALFCMSYEDGLALVNSIGGIEVIWIDLSYNMKTTPGIEIVS